jgi:antiviral helicase SKI2
MIGSSRDLLALEAQDRIVAAFEALRSRRLSGDEDRSSLIERSHLQGLPQRDELEQDLVKRFLTPSARLPPSWLDDMQECADNSSPRSDRSLYSRSWDDPIDPASLFHLEPSAPTTTLDFQTAGLEGRIIGYKEVSRHPGPALDATNSTSLARRPDDATSFIRGKSGHFPFAPGGLTTGLETEINDGDVVEDLEKGLELAAGGIRTVPPGFERGLDFGEQRT